ncbi:AAA family ATPase [Aliidiomarina quisquiliarum]|uniref:AAA family ATPase n=1 Tax=Aliidiomarina quisquiliarum TaxID=2938947 RepID=UPI00208F60BE|nr:AAA family ATPase [Aliidiomarina quisquiliarum]MCO4321909.1 AAA family ATPase [Aliidiomarina quisquiliarum]
MYQEFFGFTEQPFSIAPDPRFLFLGPRHQEALAHLRHGLTGSGGFLLLTGEVGTGKTTLSRAIISELENELEVVFILNPRLSERELLAAIAEGFGITQVNEHSSLKALTDVLSKHLMAAVERDKHPVVLIDEAQHLYPAVLEQLRLLTNLESDSKKLLSVVLIGQPELRELLQRQELRQVAQRIVARYQLLPFTRAETEQYLNHRLELANGNAGIFDKAARGIIWQSTQGTPRLINLLCDRALQIAARQGQQVVTRSIIMAATSALPYATEPSKRTPTASVGRWLVIIGIIALTSSVVWQGYLAYIKPAAIPTDELIVSPPTEQGKQLAGQPLNMSLAALAASWQLGNLGLGQQPCERLGRYNLLCVKAKVSLADIAGLSIPVIAELHNGTTIVIRSKDQNSWLIEDTAGLLQLTTAELTAAMNGNVLLFVNPPPFLNQATLASWHQWVNTRLAALVPYSLQHAPLEQQREWLVDVTAGLSKDDAWLFATLATATEYQGPSFNDYQTSNYPTMRAVQVPSPVTESISYTAPTATLTQLEPPEFRLVWPEQRSEPLLNIPEPTVSSAITTSEPIANENEPEPSYALQTIFEEAVRATPPVETKRNWSFDIESPTAQNQTESQVIGGTQGVVALAALSAEQREKIPSHSYDQHVYQSSPAERWIGLSNSRLHEGDYLGALKVLSIQPNYSILSVGDLLFKVEALEDL